MPNNPHFGHVRGHSHFDRQERARLRRQYGGCQALYDRLAWVAFHPKKFIAVDSYFGPDRRNKIEGLPNGIGRRADDVQVSVGADVGPALSQDEIDGLLQQARNGDA
jgi:hypothetical protein